MTKLLALDYGGTFVKSAVVDDDGLLTVRKEVPAKLDTAEHFAEIATDLYAAVKGEVDGVAISMPGVLDSETGYAYAAGSYNAAVGKKNIIELLKPYIDVPVSIENDGKAAVLAEAWKGSLQGVSDAAACIVGSGLGGGVIMDGKLRKGAHFASGEISALMTNPNNFSLTTECAAAKASTSSLLMMVAAAKGLSPALFEISGFMSQTDSDVKPIYSGRDVFRWIEEGDETVIAVYKQWIANLTMILFNLKMTLDPEKIVVGGGISRNETFMKDLKASWDAAQQPLRDFGMPVCELDVCKFTADANLVGAAYRWHLQYNS